MKKILKKATTVACASVLTIGFIGSTAQESHASSKRYGGKTTVNISIPKSLTEGTLKLSYGSDSLSYTTSVFGGKETAYLTAYSNKKNGSIPLKATFTKRVETTNKKDDLKDGIRDGYKTVTTTKSIKVKVSDVKKYKYKVTLKKNALGLGNFIDDISISKVKK